ncbi:MAG TPA: NADH-quinone oxidoreductase subunit NuoH [Dehalococcoidia bacterium]|nr:NADH-quinone oxidoreductase subunit NuoH [Dehalococcoidia bacterium]
MILKRLLDWLAGYWPEWAAYVVVGLVGIMVLIAFFLTMIMVVIWLERKLIGRFQVRWGPNRAGPWGILQPIADAIKVLTKEDIVPDRADKWVHLLAPVVAFVPPLLIFAVIPFQPDAILADLNIGILYVVAVGSIAVVGAFMAGWGSSNKYSLISAMRVAAQMVSYEVPLVLSIIGVILVVGSLSMMDIVNRQSLPFFLMQPLGFLVFFLAAAAEVNRSPFDLLEAESEIIAGYHVEYSGMKFALFYLGEYGHALAASALVTALFLGGGKFPWGALPPSFIWFLAKMVLVFCVLFWIRSTLPRLRVDQFTGFAWKFLFPMSLINIFLVGTELWWAKEMGWSLFPWPFLFLNWAIAGMLVLVWPKLFQLGVGRVEV